MDQVLIIDPANELTFIGPFTAPVSSVMTLRNPSDRKVCFKIKTTAPKKYCVKPNSGVIDPKQTVSVTVSLQPFDYDPSEKNRHKFMVQSTFAPDGEINQDTLWKEADGKPLMDSKLKCVFVLPDDSNGFTTNGVEPSSGQGSVSKPSVSTSNKGDDPSLKKSSDEIKKLQEEISSLRQENIQLKEEALRQGRFAANALRLRDHEAPSSEALQFKNAQEPSALATAYIYAALIIFVIGIILGKWIF